MKLPLKKFSNEDLIDTYAHVIKELKKRGIIRSRNVVGDLGEYLAIQYYNKKKGLPKLQPAPTGTKNVDALSINGDRYSIKATTGSVTSVFYGLNPPDSEVHDDQMFEYVILVMFDKDMNLKSVYEITWKQFIEYKKWHSRMKAWNLTLSKDLLSNSKKIYTLE